MWFVLKHGEILMIPVQLMNLTLAETCLTHWETIKHSPDGLGTFVYSYMCTYVHMYLTTVSVS